MFKESLEKIKSMLKNESKNNNKKTIENLVVFLVLLIIVIIAINTIWGNEKNDKNNTDNDLRYKELAEDLNSINISNNVQVNEYNLEQSLEDILSKISGVGKVDVLITYSETSKVVPMYNEKNATSITEETDTNGGTRKIEETDANKEIIYEDKNGQKSPITQKVDMPKIEGAIVTAEGAKDIDVKTSIIEAVSAATGLSRYRIQVFEMSD